MSDQKRRQDVRNVAIIAHVDHGKTTLVDALLKQTGAYEFKAGETAIMDSNPLEKERGITIFSKIASFVHKGVQFNIVDTPGHADFGSEVERILEMVDGVLLLVDAFEGPMPQTKFVLKKSLELHLKPILVINKIDRNSSQPHSTADSSFDLFCELNATDEQLDFPIVYASGKDGWTTLDLEEPGRDMKPLLDTILRRVLPPLADPEKPFQMLVTLLDYDPYVGQISIGRIFHGEIARGDPVSLVKNDGSIKTGRVTRILKYRGLVRVEAESARAGDIVSLAGVDDVKVGNTLATGDNPEALPRIKIDEPTISMVFSHNTSPLAGRDGGIFLTSRHLRERLEREALTNVGIKVEPAPGGEGFKVSGRGELHLSILIETMRREGYEMEVSAPRVILMNMGDQTLEPMEEVIIEVDEGYQGAVIAALGERKGVMKDMNRTFIGTIRMSFIIPTRWLFGFRAVLLQITRGSGIMYQNFYRYQKYLGEGASRQVGVLISKTAGKAVAFALDGLQGRGEIFIRPGDRLYEGMIVGVNNKGKDLVVNATKEKQLSNMRASGADEAIKLIEPRELTLEFALEFIADDELFEITPKHIRLRKRYLSENERKSRSRRAG